MKTVRIETIPLYITEQLDRWSRLTGQVRIAVRAPARARAPATTLPRAGPSALRPLKPRSTGIVQTVLAPSSGPPHPSVTETGPPPPPASAPGSAADPSNVAMLSLREIETALSVNITRKKAELDTLVNTNAQTLAYGQAVSTYRHAQLLHEESAAKHGALHATSRRLDQELARAQAAYKRLRNQMQTTAQNPAWAAKWLTAFHAAEQELTALQHELSLVQGQIRAAAPATSGSL